MNQTKLSLESENLAIDWIGLKIKKLKDLEKINQIQNYLEKRFNFKSYFFEIENSRQEMIQEERIKKTTVEDSWSVYLMSYQYYDNAGTLLTFSGKNAEYFYSLIKEQRINWYEFFCDEYDLSLSRLDVHYFRESTKKDGDVKDLLEQSKEKIVLEFKNRTVNFERNSKDLFRKSETEKAQIFTVFIQN